MHTQAPLLPPLTRSHPWGSELLKRPWRMASCSEPRSANSDTIHAWKRGGAGAGANVVGVAEGRGGEGREGRAQGRAGR